MKITTTLAAALLALTPSFAMAMCQWGDHKEQTAMTCAEGTMMDEKTGTCVPIVTG